MNEFLPSTPKLQNDVFDFVARFCSVEKRKLQPSTRLREDIGVDGDEAADFILAFSNQFNMSLEGLELSKYFHSEWFLSFPIPIIYWLFGCSPHLVSITVADLIEFAGVGLWSNSAGRKR